MDAVYLCLTCMKVAASAGDCHDRPMIRCGNFGAGENNPGPANPIAAPAVHWLVETVAAMYASRSDEAID